MPNVFISYRREDSADSAGRIRDRLAQHFGEAHVFFDVDDIPAGVDFVNTIQRRVSTCDALVAVIGKGWLTATDSYGKHRLENEEDYVRVEIAAVLHRGTPVVPVLVGNAAMPQALDLPDLLKPLTRINALDIRFNRFGQDVDRLISTIENRLKVGSDINSTGEEGERQPRVTLPRITDVDQTVEKLLRLERAKLFSVVAITFNTPDIDFPPPSVTLPAVDIFLYGVRQHQSDTDWDETRPFRVEHSYVITAWPNESAANTAADEHWLLSEISAVFAQHPTIPTKVLQGELKAKNSPFTSLTIQPSDRQDTSQLWQSLGRKARTSLSYTVTVSVRAPRKPSVTRRPRGSSKALNTLEPEKSEKLDRS
jgi:Pvc16 N-terminal domain/TIR domain